MNEPLTGLTVSHKAIFIAVSLLSFLLSLEPIDNLGLLEVAVGAVILLKAPYSNRLYTRTFIKKIIYAVFF